MAPEAIQPALSTKLGAPVSDSIIGPKPLYSMVSVKSAFHLQLMLELNPREDQRWKDAFSVFLSCSNSMRVRTFGAACLQPRFLATRSSSLLGLAGVHFLVGLQRPSLVKLALEASDAAAAKVGEGKKESKDKHLRYQKIYLPIWGLFLQKGSR